YPIVATLGHSMLATVFGAQRGARGKIVPCPDSSSGQRMAVAADAQRAPVSLPGASTETSKLLENPEVTIQTCSSLNPATLLPGTEEQEHDCLETIDAQNSSPPDLKDQPILNADYEWYTDGSSTVVNGQRRAGYAVATLHDTMEANSLPTGTSAQLAELVALTCALELSQGKRINIFTDSKYAFGVLHAHAGLWKQRGMLTAQGSQVKYSPQILRLLAAVQLPSEVAVMHCKAHQKEDQDVAKGNARADREVHKDQSHDCIWSCMSR
uniref:RNase H type-1 domain-containing protein n=1 Tax=Gopherus agassizii TaxID=38772 RepID=A0A452HJL8_9SAUR